MTKTKAKTATSPEPNPQALVIVQQTNETSADAAASTSLLPTVQAGLTLMDYNRHFGELSVNRLVSDLAEQCEKTFAGDLRRAEALLVAQAHTLDAIFHRLARKANNCEFLNQLDVNLRLALKAQNQCRATLETLAEIKNPMAGAYVRQANIAAGHQRVNNGAPLPGEESRAREFQGEQNKLSEDGHGLPTDTGAPAHTGGNDPHMETLGEINRAKVAAG